jgi:hypothetical protein
VEKARVMVVRRVAWRADNMVVVLIQREARRGEERAKSEALRMLHSLRTELTREIALKLSKNST